MAKDILGFMKSYKCEVCQGKYGDYEVETLKSKVEENSLETTSGVKFIHVSKLEKIINDIFKCD